MNALLRLGAVLVLSLIVLGYWGQGLSVTALLLMAFPAILLVRRPWLGWVVVMLLVPLLVSVTRDEAVVLAGLLEIYLAVAQLAFCRTWRFTLPAMLVSVLVQVTLFTFFMRGADQLAATPVIVLIMLCVYLVANSAGEARRRAAAARVRETERAIEAERLRIAREMHDLIAHSLGVIAIQAGVGSRVIETQPAEARNALSAIESTSRQTLAELRRTLTALRRSDPEGAPAAPAPGLSDLGRLVCTARDAGVAVEVERLGAVRKLPADLELSAFRIVQESVTNVVRHAQTPSCLVRLDFGDGHLSIEILDDGRAGVDALGSGYGLVGMRERATLLQGEFSAGPRPEGGFRVAARLPLPA